MAKTMTIISHVLSSTAVTVAHSPAFLLYEPIVEFKTFV